MTERVYATPEEGRGTRMERNTRTRRNRNTDLALGGLALVVVVIVALILHAVFVKAPTSTKGNVAPRLVQSTQDAPDEPAPGWPDGIHNWTQWEAVARPEDRIRLQELRGITPEMTARWAAEEGVMGKEFVTKIPVGTVIENSGWNGDGWYAVNGYVVKEGDDLFLTDADGVIAVKVSCGNPVGPPKPTVTEEVDKDEDKCLPKKPKAPMYSSPLTTPHHPDNPYTQDDPTYDVTAPTPGYIPGNVEVVESNRGTGEGTTGAPGTGAGGVTPGGSTTVGGVTTVTDPTVPEGDPVDGGSGVVVEPGDTGLDPDDFGND